MSKGMASYHRPHVPLLSRCRLPPEPYVLAGQAAEYTWSRCIRQSCSLHGLTCGRAMFPCVNSSSHRFQSRSRRNGCGCRRRKFSFCRWCRRRVGPLWAMINFRSWVTCGSRKKDSRDRLKMYLRLTSGEPRAHFRPTLRRT